MKTIKELEKQVWDLIGQKTAAKDTRALGLLNPLAKEIENLQKKFESLAKQVEGVEEKLNKKEEPKPKKVPQPRPPRDAKKKIVPKSKAKEGEKPD